MRAVRLNNSMRKIVSLFEREYEGTRLVFNEVVPGAEWVLAGEGIATRKFDGTCCMVQHGKLFKRYDATVGKTPPVGFVPAQDPDATTGHWPGWLPVSDSPDDRWHREAFTGSEPDGTYELCGPKVQGNSDKFDQHVLVPHGKETLADAPRTFDALKDVPRITRDRGNCLASSRWPHGKNKTARLFQTLKTEEIPVTNLNNRIYPFEDLNPPSLAFRFGSI
jgi:hypothetical protein